jgi:hypothetical protein
MQTKTELKPDLSIVFLDEYQLTYKRLLSLVKEKYNCQLILMTWFILTCGRMHESRSNGSEQQNYNHRFAPGHFIKMKKKFLRRFSNCKD